MSNVNEYLGLLSFLTIVKQNLELKQRKLKELKMEDVRNMWDLKGANDKITQTDLYDVAPVPSDDIWDELDFWNAKYVRKSDGVLISKYDPETCEDIVVISDYMPIRYPQVYAPYVPDYITDDHLHNPVIYSHYYKDGNLLKTCITGADGLFSSNWNVVNDTIFLKSVTFGKNILTYAYNTGKGNLKSAFKDAANLIEIKGLNNIDTSNVDDFSLAFSGCSSLTSLDLTSWDIRSATSMNYMFQNCSNLTEIKVSRDKWVIPEGCSTTNMFKGCGCSEVTYVD